MYHEPCPCHEPAKPDPSFSMECVIICVNYHDFLRNTLPENKVLFDKVIVVTAPEDRETQRICEFYHVQCIVTDRLETRHNRFCKGAAINDGLRELSKKNWVVHMDADIWLPPQTRILLGQANLDKNMIYGIDRHNVRGLEAWHRFLEKPKLQHECGSYIHMNAFPLGTRVMQNHMGGYIPIGFFQMWNPEISGIDRYPEGHTDAGREDLLFANYWNRRCRALIPEVIGYHLEGDDAGYGTNWKGRKTAPYSLFEKAKD